ncbi:lytic murein transglycosylase [Antarcticimicrobium luteum]|uniref:Lytic murein transglycosylase n=1 Tax=Antarcticimicrobium luteum TaxID=2547397 RepID=A0A4R5VE42_9RHOB|nr:lytic murein transglycosylase [Antarcticimicrobium luteum]TDK50045.1 lytic murein transglycosylase [Antarcticimicrobium luteum]
MRVWLCAAGLALFGADSVLAEAVMRSSHPEIRPPVASDTVQRASSSVLVSLRPSPRPVRREAVMPTVNEHAANVRFQNWIGAFKDRAAAQGIRRHVLDRAFAGVQYDAEVIRRDRNQSEFTKPIWEYLESAASDSRIANGRKALEDNRATLEAIERRYGVDKEVVLAIWGLESAYGSHRGKDNLVRSLATLSFDGRRARFFESQLIAALRILQSGDTTPQNMTGSWAGAMGHTQFMPTSYLEYAVDFTGDGRRDIWSDDPTDALASTAAYLKRFGWIKGQPWGIEVRLPPDFDFKLAQRQIKKPAADWARLGVRDVEGRSVPDHGAAAILLPAGGHGAAFMVFDNFRVIERYNPADAYVIGVGHLADRIRGGAPVQAEWPRGDRVLTLAERKEMQRLLTAKGYQTAGIDGRIGPKTMAAVRAYQTASGLLPDGYASLDLLKRLR